MTGLRELAGDIAMMFVASPDPSDAAGRACVALAKEFAAVTGQTTSEAMRTIWNLTDTDTIDEATANVLTHLAHKTHGA